MTEDLRESERDAKEDAYVYDLIIAPQWREVFDKIADEELKLPGEGRFLDAGCGTGGYAVDLAQRGGAKVEVVGIDPVAERLALARSKATVKKLDRVTFFQGSLLALGSPDEEFDLVLGDGSMLPAEDFPEAWAELARVARPGAAVAMKLTTRGSFDEFFSLFWEALYELDLTSHTPALEALITERPTITDAERAAIAAGLRQVRSVTRKERFDFDDAAAFFASPLMTPTFLDGWLAIVPDEATRARVERQLRAIIDRERQAMAFDVSIKATLVVGRK